MVLTVLGNGHILKIDPPGGSADMSMVLTVLVLNIYGTADHPVPTLTSPITFSPSSTRKTPPDSWIYNVFPDHKCMLASDFLFPENVVGNDEPCRNFSTRPTDHPVPTWMRDLVLIFIAPALRRCWWWRLRAVFCGQLLPVTYLLVAFSTLRSGVVQADFFSRSILV